MDRSAFIDSVHNILGDSETAETCEKLVYALFDLPEEEGRFLTFTSMQNLVQRQSIDRPLVEAVNFLTSSTLHLLDAHGQFVDSDGEEYEIDPGEFDDLLATGSLIHPVSGERIEDAKRFVVPYFVVSISSDAGGSQ